MAEKCKFYPLLVSIRMLERRTGRETRALGIWSMDNLVVDVNKNNIL